MFSSDIVYLKNKIHKVETAYLDWVIRGCQNKEGMGDTFMLRVEMLDLQRAIEEILQREQKETK